MEWNKQAIIWLIIILLVVWAALYLAFLTEPDEVPENNSSGLVFCTADVKECPDGSFVSRDGQNNCEFGPCP